MDLANLTFFILAGVLMAFSLATVLSPNPIFSSLYLAMTMISLAFIFFQLKAYFIGGVQLIVYAGAVMVLFVMVLMLFDLKKELEAFSKGFVSNFLKIASAGILLGFLAGITLQTSEMLVTSPSFSEASTTTFGIQELSITLFTDYLLAFETLGFLLLMVAIGAVSVARMKGGTHAQHD